MRLSFTVEQRDVEVARSILDHCLKKNVGDDDAAEDDINDMLVNGEEHEDRDEQGPAPAKR